MLGDFLKIIIIQTLVVETDFSWEIEVHLSQIVKNFVNPFLGSSGVSLGSCSFGCGRWVNGMKS